MIQEIDIKGMMIDMIEEIDIVEKDPRSPGDYNSRGYRAVEVTFGFKISKVVVDSLLRNVLFVVKQGHNIEVSWDFPKIFGEK